MASKSSAFSQCIHLGYRKVKACSIRKANFLNIDMAVPHCAKHPETQFVAMKG